MTASSLHGLANSDGVKLDGAAAFNRSALLDLIADMIAGARRHPLGVAGLMLADEAKAGRRPVQPGEPAPFDFPAEDWPFPQVVSIDGDEVRLIAIRAAVERSGALKRLVASIRAAGLTPVIVAPVGVAMPAILRRWGWVGTVKGDGWEQVDEWRPSTEEQRQPAAPLSVAARLAPGGIQNNE